MANQFLGLSLFIMLLSFFLILNAVSGFDSEKARPVLNSLTTTFSAETDTTPLDVGDIPSSRRGEAEGTTLDRIHGLFASHIAGIEHKQNRLGTLLRIRMPFKVFEQEVLSSLKTGGETSSSAFVQAGDGKGFFLPTLVSLMDTENGTPYKMDMVAYAFSEDAEPQKNNLARRISRIAALIEEAGLPKKMVSAGIGIEAGGMVDLYFRPYVPFDPDVFRPKSGDSDGG